MSDNVHRDDKDAIDGAHLNDIDGAETPEELRDFAMEIFDVIRDIRDPEKPETLEELDVLKEESVCVNYLDAQCAKRLGSAIWNPYFSHRFPIFVIVLVSPLHSILHLCSLLSFH